MAGLLSATQYLPRRPLMCMTIYNALDLSAPDHLQADSRPQTGLLRFRLTLLYFGRCLQPFITKRFFRTHNLNPGAPTCAST